VLNAEQQQQPKPTLCY